MENLKNLPPFYSGQKVLYLNHMAWVGVADGITYGGPKKDETVTVASCFNTYMGWAITLCEYPLNPGDGFMCIEPCGRVNFAPTQQSKFPLIEYEEVIERERQLITAN